MVRMTDEEADALDEYYTKNPPKTDPTKPGIFARNVDHMVILDDLSAGYIRSRAEASRKTPTQIIGDLVRREITRTTDTMIAMKRE